ncbi:MAG: dephospho-CoA kinase [Solirubrobacterales bacterium]
MLFVGLTGGIGSGKSEALAACERLGVPVLSTDAVVHELLQTDEVKSELLERWGESILADGEIDRDRVAEIVFESPDELSWLEQTLFPRVGRRMLHWREDLERAGRARVAVVEVPLLFEAGIEEAFDATIAVVADEQLRAQRAGARDHKGLGGRGARQLSQQDKAGRADRVVQNDGSLEDLERAIAATLDELKAKAKAGEK